MKVSVILPTYNEAGNIVPLVEAISAHMPAGLDYEIIVVDDNSPDGTFEAVRNGCQSPRVIPVLRTTDRGFAKSIRAGIERSSGDTVVIMDTDFTHTPATVPIMIHVSQMFQVVIGSRFSAGGSMPDVPHYLASLIYNWFLRALLRTQIQDNLSGFLTVRRETLAQLPFDDIFFGYGDYCIRLLHYAQRVNATIVEVPVQYDLRRKGASKSVFWQLLFKYSWAAIKLRLRASSFQPSAAKLPPNHQDAPR
jgi:dolichol-phosphate mannosyltransferase